MLAGNLLRAQVTFTDPTTGALVDPTTVAISYRVDPGPATILTLSGGGVTKASTGVYQALIDTTGMAGTLAVSVTSTGTGQAAATDSIDITPAA